MIAYVKSNWKAIIRDLIILWVINYFGRFIIITIIKSVDINKLLANMIGSIYILFIISGAIIGSINKAFRFKHLLCVWMAYFFTGLIFGLESALKDTYALFYYIIITIGTLISFFAGGLISLVLVKPAKPAEIST